MPLRILLIATSLWTASISPVMADDNLLKLTIGYRERIAPPPNAVLEVALLDVSRADVAATRLSSQRFKLTGVPMDVTLRYDPALIDNRQSYSVSAAILSGEVTHFRTTAHHLALTRDATHEIELMLTKVSQQISSSDESGSIAGLTWEVIEIAGRAVSIDDPPTLTLDGEGRFGLYSGCNRFTGIAEIHRSEDGAGALSFPQDFAGTLMACPQDREKLQQDVLNAMSTVSGYTREDDTLTLNTQAGAAVLRLRAQPE
ncbi:MAG: YbaY family lipoprotein [Pseudomonadota bacterium]